MQAKPSERVWPTAEVGVSAMLVRETEATDG